MKTAVETVFIGKDGSTTAVSCKCAVITLSSRCLHVAKRLVPPIDETKLHLGDDIAAIGQRHKQRDGMRVILQGISDKGIGQFIGCRDLMEQGEATQKDTDAQALPKESEAC
jgi:hypothetical protein